MSRRYNQDEKDHALEILIVNSGDVALTSFQTGVPERTLTRWKRSMGLGMAPEMSAPQPPPQPQPSLSADKVAALRDLQEEMLLEANNLVHSIQEAIKDAPLGQRVAALAQLIDRIMKLDVQLPQDDADDEVKILYHQERYEQDDPFDGTTPESEDDPR